MKKAVFGLLVALACCSGQLCGPVAPPVSETFSPAQGSSSSTNICGRSEYNAAYGIGVSPPADATQSQGQAPDGVAVDVKWTWNVCTPPVTFEAMIFNPAAETTLEQFRQAWLDQLKATQGLTVQNESYVTLDDGGQGWYVGVTSTQNSQVLLEFVMTVSQGRLAYVSALHDPALVTDAQETQISDFLHSLCADKE